MHEGSWTGMASTPNPYQEPTQAENTPETPAHSRNTLNSLVLGAGAGRPLRRADERRPSVASRELVKTTWSYGGTTGTESVFP